MLVAKDHLARGVNSATLIGRVVIGGVVVRVLELGVECG